jgi:hypothetical protein
MSILLDEDGAEWECLEADDGSVALADERGGKAFRTLQFRPVDNPGEFVHEMIVSTEFDLDDAVIQRRVLQWVRQAAVRFTN